MVELKKIISEVSSYLSRSSILNPIPFIQLGIRVPDRLDKDTGNGGQRSTSTAETLHPPPDAVSLPVPQATDVTEEDLENEEAVVSLNLFRNLSLDRKHTHFVGRSSSLAVFRTAMTLKQEYTNEDYSDVMASPACTVPYTEFTERPEFWDSTAVSGSGIKRSLALAYMYICY